jgi:carbon-monoxide dehydrogenase medium subunit
MRFEYLEPDSVESAVRLLDQYRDRVRVLAGGTDLVVQMRARKIRPEFVLSIGLLEELKGIAITSGRGLHVGTLTTMRMVEKSKSLPLEFDVLRQGATQVSSPQIRNVATLGGNLCNGIPSADTVPSLIALGAQAILVSTDGRRLVSIETFHTGPGRTVLRSNELLLGFEIPPQPAFTGGSYLKYTPRGTFELAVVGVAAMVTLRPADMTCERARIVLGACGPTPLRARNAESLLMGKRVDDRLIEEASRVAAGEAQPNPGVSVRAPAPYRREMVRIFSRRALKAAVAKALAGTT